MDPDLGDLPDLIDTVLARGPARIRPVPAGPAPAPGSVAHPHPRLLVVVRGRHPVAPLGVPETLGPGEGLLFAPGSWHHLGSGGPRTYLSLLCDPRGYRCFRRRHPGGRRTNAGSTLAWSTPPDPALAHQAAACTWCQDPGILAVLARGLLLLFRARMGAEPAEPSGAARTFRRVRDWCAEHLDGRLSRTQVARHFDLHPGYLTELFHRFAGMSFQDWCGRERLERARLLLRAQPEAPVSAIAALCGFDDPRYFRRRFRHCFGMPPSRSRV